MPYTCEKCNKSFKDKYVWTNHINRKTSCVSEIDPGRGYGEAYKCKDCGTFFDQKSHLQRHQARKTPCKIQNSDNEVEKDEAEEVVEKEMEVQVREREDSPRPKSRFVASKRQSKASLRSFIDDDDDDNDDDDDSEKEEHKEDDEEEEEEEEVEEEEEEEEEDDGRSSPPNMQLSDLVTNDETVNEDENRRLSSSSKRKNAVSHATAAVVATSADRPSKKAKAVLNPNLNRNLRSIPSATAKGATASKSSQKNSREKAVSRNIIMREDEDGDEDDEDYDDERDDERDEIDDSSHDIAHIVDESNSNLNSNSNSSLLEFASHDVVVVGSLMTDLCTYSTRLPVIGETIRGDSFERNFGGKGANQAVQCARLGGKVLMVGTVGNDQYGRDYLTQLASEGIDTSAVKISVDPGNSTGIASIFIGTSEGENSIIIVPGANNECSAVDCDKIERQIAASKAVLCQNEIPMECTLQALKLAKKHNVLTIYNPAPAPSIEGTQSQIFREIIANSDIFCPNETELSLLTDMPTDTDDEIKSAAESLLRMGCLCVIVTLGARGASIFDLHFEKGANMSGSATKARLSLSSSSSKGGASVPGFDSVTSSSFAAISELRKENEKRLNWATKRSKHVEGPRVTAVDTVGAGDSFIGTLAWAMAVKNIDLLAAVEFAVVTSGVSVERKGAQKSYASLAELDLNP